MSPILHIDWQSLLVPRVGLIELFLRGSAMYLGILALMRAFRRQKGALNAADLLVLLLVADAAQNAMSANYQSITEGVVLVGTVFTWDFALDALAFRYPRMHRLLNGEPLLLIKDGALQRRNLRSEMLTVADLVEQLREQGVADIGSVRKCFLEADGHISVIKNDASKTSKKDPPI